MWVSEKICVSAEKTNLSPWSSLEHAMFGEKYGKAKRISLCPNVITPDTIPPFCIPPNILSLQKVKAAEGRGGLPSIRVSPCDAPPLHGCDPHNEPVPTQHIIQVESVDDGPYDEGYGEEETTNADPQSQAALSLPHVAKTQTSYGFCTLLESPHTRRKESLFHSDPISFPFLLPRSRSHTCSKVSPRASPSSSPSSFSLNSLTSRLSPRSYALNRQSALDSDTASSNESSPFSSPPLSRCPAKSSIFKTLSHERLLSRNMRTGMGSRNNSLSTDEGSSTDNSPSVTRRLSDETAKYSLAPPSFFHMDVTLSEDRRTKESVVQLGKDGSLRLWAEYSSGNQNLRVLLISAEGLYALSVDTKSINCSVSLSLIPGKLQKQRSTVIRKSRNPVFNEDFFFDGLTEEDLAQRSLRFKVVNKKSTMKRDYVLGDCDLPLSSIVSF